MQVSWSYDLDSGGQSEGKAGDFSWEMVKGGKPYLEPRDGAFYLAGNKDTYKSLTLEMLERFPYSRAAIGAMAVEKNVVAYKTRQGHFGKFLVVSSDPEGTRMNIQYVTYK